MKVLYIDNFRGFESTFLPFEDVNFFVGENSTGKTSILKLLGIVSSNGFWNYQDFNNNGIGFNSFSDIITIGSKKEFFDIGIIDFSDKDNFSAIKLRFIEEKNLPQIKELSILNEFINIQAAVDGDFLKYRFENWNNSTLISEDLFKNWIKNNNLHDKTFLRNEIEFLGIRTLMFQLQSFLKNEKVDLKGASKENVQKEFRLSIPSFLKDLAWTPPTRPVPLKTYDKHIFSFTPEGIHTPYILKDILSDKVVQHILNRFGSDSGLFDNIDVKTTLGDKLNNANPFEILLMLNNKLLNITNVGYGVSQILPLIIEVIARPEGTWFAIQQPEIHLHPKAQAAFGDFLFKSNIIDNHKFIIETHSDYTIDRYRIRINRLFKQKVKHKESRGQVFFFTRTEKGNKLDVININTDGSYSDNQPKEFREFFIKEQFELITI